MERAGRRLARGNMVIGRHYIGERFVAQAIADRESMASTVDREHEMPFAMREQFGDDAAGRRHIGQGQAQRRDPLRVD